MSKPIAVGVDGSDQGTAAAHYAAALAVRRGAPLRLIYVFETLYYGLGPMFATGGYGVAEEHLRTAAQQTLDEITDRISAAHPDLEVEPRMREGGAAAVLIAETQESAVTVVGSRGLGGFAELVIGSVSAQVSAHAHNPVIVFRPPHAEHGPVLVGYDGSDPAKAALQFAVQEALSQGVPLVVANAYWPQPWGFGETPVPDPNVTAAHDAEALVDAAVAPYRKKHSQLQVETRTIHSLNPEHSLIEESKHARLTVIGSRGRGGFTGLLLGSVSQALVHHAAGPVAVVHSG
ncbi:universal stress protein [Allorhizocola rhizosphaerae]|uniref:universal stress protein n=1 Tax=Allorhizocola rhizosphaerae TaxID=1872709 RepID=UPI000E3D5772|nr:universal stress protein [Allorhizocola rhizosphaerae]